MRVRYPQRHLAVEFGCRWWCNDRYRTGLRPSVFFFSFASFSLQIIFFFSISFTFPPIVFPLKFCIAIARLARSPISWGSGGIHTSTGLDSRLGSIAGPIASISYLTLPEPRPASRLCVGNFFFLSSISSFTTRGCEFITAGQSARSLDIAGSRDPQCMPRNTPDSAIPSPGSDRVDPLRTSDSPAVQRLVRHTPRLPLPFNRKIHTSPCPWPCFLLVHAHFLSLCEPARPGLSGSAALLPTSSLVGFSASCTQRHRPTPIDPCSAQPHLILPNF